MSTIHDVAREAGVSIATVSRVLQGSSKVQPKTRELVDEAIKRLDYRPNRLAQQFRSQRTGDVLVILPDIGNTFFSEIIDGIDTVAQKNHYSILIADSHGISDAEEHYYEMLRDKRVDGIISFSSALPSERLLDYSAEGPIVIGVRYIENSQIPNVTIDNMKAAADITRYMLNLGHQKFCYLAGPDGARLYRSRRQGFLSALQERDITINPALMVTCDASIQGGYEAVSSLINSAADFTAVVASGDTMAIGAIRALNNFGLRVPEDIAVAGFDDIELSRLLSPTLTTVRQPKQQIGRHSMEILLDLINGKPMINYRTMLDYELVIRESSGNFIKQEK